MFDHILQLERRVEMSFVYMMLLGMSCIITSGALQALILFKAAIYETFFLEPRMFIKSNFGIGKRTENSSPTILINLREKERSRKTF
jgi:hypothetical protein